jgi:hypothetical protein
MVRLLKFTYSVMSIHVVQVLILRAELGLADVAPEGVVGLVLIGRPFLVLGLISHGF